MSSLNAARADNYYIPPSYLESGSYKKKSLNQYQNSKGHNQFLTRAVARFELPFDGFCCKCENHVGKGTRFNAHKKHVDNYLTTKIYEFRMKCRKCADCQFVIRTNPQERTFDYVEGIRKKVEEFDTVANESLGIIDTDVGGNSILQGKACSNENARTGGGCDALAQLDKRAHGERTSMTERDKLEALMKHNHTTSFDDNKSNSTLRSKYRKERKNQKRRCKEAQSHGLFGMELSDLSPDDIKNSQAVFDKKRLLDIKAAARSNERGAFRSIRGGSIFSSADSKSPRNIQGKVEKVDGTNVRKRMRIQHSSLSSNIAMVGESGGKRGKYPDIGTTKEASPPTSTSSALDALMGYDSSDSD